MRTGSSTTMSVRRHSAFIMRLFYAVAIWATFIHRAKGIPWTEEKVGPIELGGFVHIKWS